MQFEELLLKRRSIRNYQDKEVPLDLLKGLINDCILAPSAGNEQPWKFIIITDQEMINRISEESKRSILARIRSNKDDYAAKYEKMLRNDAFHIFYHAPAVVLILGKTGLKNLYVDCALAACYLMMSAAKNGLGSCWINFATEIHDHQLKGALGIPANHSVVAPIALGYPEKIPAIPKRKEAEIIRIIE